MAKCNKVQQSSVIKKQLCYKPTGFLVAKCMIWELYLVSISYSCLSSLTDCSFTNIVIDDFFKQYAVQVEQMRIRTINVHEDRNDTVCKNITQNYKAWV